MSMFDDIRCKIKLPHSKDWKEEWDNASFQTKSFDGGSMDLFEIREDGSLWRETYDARAEETEDSFFGFVIHRDNIRWEPSLYSGEIRFYDYENEGRDQVEFLAFCFKGQVTEFHCMMAKGKWVTPQ